MGWGGGKRYDCCYCESITCPLGERVRTSAAQRARARASEQEMIETATRTGVTLMDAKWMKMIHESLPFRSRQALRLLPNIRRHTNRVRDRRGLFARTRTRVRTALLSVQLCSACEAAHLRREMGTTPLARAAAATAGAAAASVDASSAWKRFRSSV